ncbi:MAG: hypothetical protein R3C14_47445 [Caldilineaceae bacterium]
MAAGRWLVAASGWLLAVSWWRVAMKKHRPAANSLPPTAAYAFQSLAAQREGARRLIAGLEAAPAEAGCRRWRVAGSGRLLAVSWWRVAMKKHRPAANS